jgi:hypothetical protein
MSSFAPVNAFHDTTKSMVRLPKKAKTTFISARLAF